MTHETLKASSEHVIECCPHKHANDAYPNSFAYRNFTQISTTNQHGNSSNNEPFKPRNQRGHLLEVTVVGCNKLRDLEWISRQDPYVYVEYGGAKHRTETCTDGGKNPTFQQKFAFVLIEGLRELNLTVWNSNTLSYDNFIGNGKVHLHKVLSEGYDDSYWPLQTKTGRYAGEVHLIVHYANANKAATSLVPSAPPCVAPATPQVLLLYAAPSPASVAPYPLQTTAYAVQSRYPSYPPPPYPPPHPATYPPPPYSPPVVYPPPPYPPPPQASPYHPPGPYHGSYPPRQY